MRLKVQNTGNHKPIQSFIVLSDDFLEDACGDDTRLFQLMVETGSWDEHRPALDDADPNEWDYDPRRLPTLGQELDGKDYTHSLAPLENYRSTSYQGTERTTAELVFLAPKREVLEWRLLVQDAKLFSPAWKLRIQVWRFVRTKKSACDATLEYEDDYTRVPDDVE